MMKMGSCRLCFVAVCGLLTTTALSVAVYPTVTFAVEGGDKVFDCVNVGGSNWVFGKRFNYVVSWDGESNDCSWKYGFCDGNNVGTVAFKIEGEGKVVAEMDGAALKGILYKTEANEQLVVDVKVDGIPVYMRVDGGGETVKHGQRPRVEIPTITVKDKKSGTQTLPCANRENLPPSVQLVLIRNSEGEIICHGYLDKVGKLLQIGVYTDHQFTVKNNAPNMVVGPNGEIKILHVKYWDKKGKHKKTTKIHVQHVDRMKKCNAFDPGCVSNEVLENLSRPDDVLEDGDDTMRSGANAIKQNSNEIEKLSVDEWWALTRREHQNNAEVTDEEMEEMLKRNSKTAIKKAKEKAREKKRLAAKRRQYQNDPAVSDEEMEEIIDRDGAVQKPDEGDGSERKRSVEELCKSFGRRIESPPKRRKSRKEAKVFEKEKLEFADDGGVRVSTRDRIAQFEKTKPPYISSCQKR